MQTIDYNINTRYLFCIFVVLFMPKINLIPIPGYWQGIRLDDILILFTSCIYFLNNANKPLINKKGIYDSVFYYLILIFVSNILSIYLLGTVEIIMMIRLAEYFLLLYIFDSAVLSKNLISRVLKYYLLANFIVSILQYYKMLGSITSVGFLSPDHFLSQRSMGLTGGSWELGVVVSLIFLIFTIIKKNNQELFFVYIIGLGCAFLAHGRGNFVAHLICGILYFTTAKDIKVTTKVIVFCILFILSFIFQDSITNLTLFERILSIDLSNVFQMGINAFSGASTNVTEIGRADLYLSIWYRFEHWKQILATMNSNYLFWLFGIGFNVLYTESVYLRVIMTTGVLGCVYLATQILRVKVYILVYFLISGLFLDLFISMKIYCFTLLLIYVIKKKKLTRN